MPTRGQVLALVEGGASYEEAAATLGIDAGLAYMIATGLPADGGDTPTSAQRQRPGFRPGSTQRLANPETPANPSVRQHVLDWVKQRAHGDAPMRAAAARRDARPGEIRDPDGNREVVTVLTRDHNRVTALVEQLSTIPGHRKGGSNAQVQRRASIVGMIAVELSRHETAEEEHLWPAVRRVLGDGDERADEALRQEQEGRETLTALGEAAPDSDRFDDLVEELVLRLRKHVTFEEKVFHALRDALSEEERTQLGRRIRDVEAGRAAATPPTEPSHEH